MGNVFYVRISCCMRLPGHMFPELRHRVGMGVSIQWITWEMVTELAFLS